MSGLPARLRRVVALLVALALLLPAPFGALSACATCPPDCPMHHVVGAEAEPELPCHRMASSPGDVEPAAHADETVIRASCGRDVVEHVVGDVRLRPPAPAIELRGMLHDVVAGADLGPRTRVADVPTDPPRASGRS